MNNKVSVQPLLLLLGLLLLLLLPFRSRSFLLVKIPPSPRYRHLPPKSSNTAKLKKTAAFLPSMTTYVTTTAAAALSASDDENDGTGSALSIGFLGCGTIASAIVTGLATTMTTTTTSQQKLSATNDNEGKHNDTRMNIKHISVTRRSKSKSEALAKSFPDILSVHDDPQEVVDASDVVFVCVLPEQTESVLQGLKFRDNNQQQLVSLVSTASLEELCQYTALPPERVFQMICLPAVARNNGVCLLLTPHQRHPPTIYELCQSLGGCVEASTEAEMATLMTVSGLMGSFYGVLRSNRSFLTQRGIAEKDATFLVGRMYENMIQDVAERIVVDNDESSDGTVATKSSENISGAAAASIFDQLIAEQTPGGLNEQGLANLESLGVMESYHQVQAAILSRIQGETDGSLSATHTPAETTSTTAAKRAPNK